MRSSMPRTDPPAGPPLRVPRPAWEQRTPERIRAHYEIERELADRLRGATARERGALYSEVYNELFRRVPDHPQLVSQAGEARRRERIAEQRRVLQPFLRPDTTFLELGAGDCALSLALAPGIARAIALDVSDAIAGRRDAPANFSLVISDGQTVPVPAGCVTVAYSNQLMEHLHPDDAAAQLASIRAALAPGGLYLCITPNRLTGPHDVSAYFDDAATGFHLKEYTIAELARLMRAAGFRRVRVLAGARGRFALVPAWILAALESSLWAIPPALRRRLTRTRLVGALVQPRIVAWR
jgi:SAM-dependent methyltransferase